jgi:hypothetical protein
MMSGWRGVPILFPLFENEGGQAGYARLERVEKTKIRG